VIVHDASVDVASMVLAAFDRGGRRGEVSVESLVAEEPLPDLEMVLPGAEMAVVPKAEPPMPIIAEMQDLLDEEPEFTAPEIANKLITASLDTDGDYVVRGAGKKGACLYSGKSHRVAGAIRDDLRDLIVDLLRASAACDPKEEG
jgi:hypothetical protein